MLAGGTLIRYGAKAIPEGGLFAMPRPYGDGLLLIGDTAGFLNGMRLKGIHLAMKSGMMAAETLWEALQAQRYDAATLFDLRTAFQGVVGVSRNALLAQLPSGLQTRPGGRFDQRGTFHDLGRSRVRHRRSSCLPSPVTK